MPQLAKLERLNLYILLFHCWVNFDNLDMYSLGFNCTSLTITAHCLAVINPWVLSLQHPDPAKHEVIKVVVTKRDTGARQLINCWVSISVPAADNDMIYIITLREPPNFTSQ
jgi:hypothetical protein